MPVPYREAYVNRVPFEAGCYRSAPRVLSFHPVLDHRHDLGLR